MDVHVIGGGVIGLCTAWFLTEAGASVTVIDKEEVGIACSYGNAGLIVPSHFVPLASPGVIARGVRWMFSSSSPFYIKPRLNMELIRWLWLFYKSCTKEKVESAIPLLRDSQIISKSLYRSFADNPEFDFHYEEKGLLMIYKNKKAGEEEIRLAEQARSIGITTNILDLQALNELEQNVEINALGAIHYPEDAHFYSNQFMNCLEKNLNSRGVKIRRNVSVTGFKTNHKKVTQLVMQTGETEDVKNVVVASGSWSGKLLRELGMKYPMQAGKGYSITISKPISKPTIPSILVEFKAALTPMGNDLRIGGTMAIDQFSEKIHRNRVKALFSSVNEYYPELDIQIPEENKIWYGFRPCTPDGLPYIGRISGFSNLYVNAGHAMLGMSLGPVSGKLMAELVLGQNPSIDISLLYPERFG